MQGDAVEELTKQLDVLIKDDERSSEQGGQPEMKNAIHTEVLKEIFPRKYRKRQMSHEIYEQLRKMILSGKLERGQRLVEEKLANHLNVSRNPIRIAILQLREEGLVTWESKKGTFVA